MDSWATPKWLLEMFEGWFDPCPLNPNPIIDGLKIEWKDKTYVNPPYSKPLLWVKKAIEENKKGKTIVMLLTNDLTTKYSKLLIEANAHFMFCMERLKFVNPNYTKGTSRYGSMLVILQKP
jgi:hypothetical protein